MAKRQSSAKRRVTLAQAKPGAAIPPAKAAPIGYAPITTSPSQGALAPWPLIDRFPTVVGQSLTFSYLSATLRLANTGYRQQYVDLLNELLECDPHLYSVVTKRILSAAVGRLEIRPFDLPEDHPRYDAAKEAADLCESEVSRLPDLTQNLAALLWSIYHGVSASEIYWTRDRHGWHPDRLQFVHSRRLSYPDAQTWDLYVWDQGQVYGWGSAWGSSPTSNGFFGLRVKDYPGKFLVHAPQLRGDYPTREGIGRELAYWTVLKRIGARGAGEYLERFAKGFMDVTYATSDDGKPRLAEEPDIALATQIAAAIGPGSGSFAVHGDCIKLEPKAYEGTGTAKITWEQWINLCNAEMSKAALGGTINTDHRGGGGLGGKGVAESQERGEVSLEQYDGTSLAESLRRDLLWWIVKLNRPDCIDVVPHASLHVETDPDPKALIEAAKALTDIGAPVDLDALSEQTGIRLIDNESGKPRRSYRSDFADPIVVDPTLESDEAKAQRAQAQAAATAIANGNGDKPNDTDGNVGQETHPAAKPPSSEEDGETSEANAEARDGSPAWLLALRDTAASTVDRVWKQLEEDFPKKAMRWVRDPGTHWEGPTHVPVERLDFSNSASWKASEDGDKSRVDHFIHALHRGDDLKPVILVHRPGKKTLMIADGHHRALAYKRGGIRNVLAYVATVKAESGQWDVMHDDQKGRTSR